MQTSQTPVLPQAMSDADRVRLLTEGLDLQNSGQPERAAELFERCLAHFPSDPIAHYSLGVIELHAGRHQGACDVLDRGVKAAPGFAPLWLAHVSALQGLGRKQEALASYEEAIRLKPDCTAALLNCGALYRELLQHHKALERMNEVLRINPNHASALANLGILLTEYKESEKAIGMFQRLLAIAPEYDYAPGLLFYEQLHIADWSQLEHLRDSIVAGILSGKRSCKSLAFMSASDSASEHQMAARIFAQSYCPPPQRPLWKGERYRHSRIRVAYVSPDLREHPVGHLTAGLFEQHDKSRFETFAVSLGIDDQSRLRLRMVNAFEHFLDAATMGAEQIARWMRDQEIDIAVDLGGYTSDTRTAIFSYRPAPAHVNFLGYPGTMGLSYMDYIVADRYVIPPEQQHFYDERVIYLPDSYLPTDQSIQISPNTPSRAQCGLPESGFVFCCFNHDFKIMPRVFNIWMRLLQRVPGSVLWLVARAEVTRNNLRSHAQARGVSPDRLVFADRVPHVEDHLARYRQADLFLDTHPYNGHTTTADALMAGLPVLTYTGSAFPSRVAGSLLHTVGLPDMVTTTLEAYERRAFELATNPAALGEVRQRLQTQAQSSALFDTPLFCRNLENIYFSIVRQSALAPSRDEISGKGTV